MIGFIIIGLIGIGLLLWFCDVIKPIEREDGEWNSYGRY
jgi:hypothetical protein